MKRLAVLVAVGLCVGAWAAPAAAQGACTMQNLAGTYVFESRGSSTLVTGAAPAALPGHVTAFYAPIAVIGRLTIAKDGSVEGIYWGALGTGNSGPDPVQWQGQISDFADCRGAVTYAVEVMGAVATVVEHFVVVDGGKELRMVMKSIVVPGDPPVQLPATWNTTVRRVRPGNCGQPALRGEWVMTCQSLHALPPGGQFTHAAEAALITADVQADGAFIGSFDTKIGPTPARLDVAGVFTAGDACTVSGTLSPAPGVVVTAKGVLFGEGNELLVIPVQTETPAGTTPNPYDTCRGIRRDR